MPNTDKDKENSTEDETNNDTQSTNNAEILHSLQLSAALKIPPFWASRPNLWFLKVETQFRMKGITKSQTKYDYLIASLPPESMELVADFLSNPSEKDQFENVKKLLISRCQDTEEKRLDNLLNKIELGDLKPSELYRQMENLAGGNSLVNKSLLYKLWINKMPPSIQPCIIAIENSQEQEEIFQIADRIYDSTDRRRVSEIRSNDSDLKDLLVKLSERIQSLETRQSRSRSRSFSKHRNNNRSKSRSNVRAGFCWYHKRFGNKATKCLDGCKFSNSQSNSKN